MANESQLVKSVRERMNVLVGEAELVERDRKKFEARVDALKKRYKEITAEWQDLNKVLLRHQVRKEPPPSMPVPESKPGPSQWVLDFINSAGGTVEKILLSVTLRAAIRNGQVATSTKDAAKLSSSLIGNMLKRGRLLLVREGAKELIRIGGVDRAVGSEQAEPVAGDLERVAGADEPDDEDRGAP